mgnify:CR=1 FL=1
MTIILAADSDWAIGRDGGLLAHIPEDMKFFRETTANSTVVMGRKTWESIGAKPLPGRVNCVISRSVKQLDGAQVFGSVEEFLGFAEKAEGKVFVIAAARYTVSSCRTAARRSSRGSTRALTVMCSSQTSSTIGIGRSSRPLRL